jgi:hypothetical protein
VELERTGDRSLRVILVGRGNAEQRHDFVAYELVHDAVVLVNDARRFVLDAIHERRYFLRVERLVETGIAAEVGHPDRHLAAFALCERRERDVGRTLAGGFGADRAELGDGQWMTTSGTDRSVASLMGITAVKASHACLERDILAPRDTTLAGVEAMAAPRRCCATREAPA